MVFSFLGYLIWSIMGVSAYYVSKGGDKKTAYATALLGLADPRLSNGTVEAYINPVVATLFTFNKTKWLNILHAAGRADWCSRAHRPSAWTSFAPTSRGASSSASSPCRPSSSSSS
jgi:hypothetical protein